MNFLHDRIMSGVLGREKSLLVREGYAVGSLLRAVDTLLETQVSAQWLMGSHGSQSARLPDSSPLHFTSDLCPQVKPQ